MLETHQPLKYEEVYDALLSMTNEFTNQHNQWVPGSGQLLRKFPTFIPSFQVTGS